MSTKGVAYIRKVISAFVGGDDWDKMSKINYRHELLSFERISE